MGIATLRSGAQNPTSVVAALISAGIVIAIEYQKFHLFRPKLAYLGVGVVRY